MLASSATGLDARSFVAVGDARNLGSTVTAAAVRRLQRFSGRRRGSAGWRRGRCPCLVPAVSRIQSSGALGALGRFGGAFIRSAVDPRKAHGGRIAVATPGWPERVADRLGHSARAKNLSAYGYPRNTTPNLARWARQGVRFDRALAPAPWTYPSHSCFFTGQWPFKLNSQWKFALDTPDPTLAEYLTARGYQTAGFSANTNCCNYETGLARGISHFEDFPLTPRSLVGRTQPGRWILQNILYRGFYHDIKWIGLQSRGAHGTNDAFLDWLRQRRPDRPFFAFVNYFDAHAPYLPPRDTQVASESGPDLQGTTTSC